jgi:hypothetical protein
LISVAEQKLATKVVKTFSHKRKGWPKRRATGIDSLLLVP